VDSDKVVEEDQSECPLEVRRNKRNMRTCREKRRCFVVKTECAICGKGVHYDLNLFVDGKTGEPICRDCKEQEEEVREDG